MHDKFSTVTVTVEVVVPILITGRETFVDLPVAVVVDVIAELGNTRVYRGVLIIAVA